MSGPRMSVSKSGNTATLTFTSRGTIGERELEALLQKVFFAVNPAAKVPEGQKSGSAFQALYDDGPLLFKQMVMDAATKRSHSELGGLQVSTTRLPATVSQLRALGVEVSN